MLVETDILVIYVDGGDDEQFMPWVESFANNINSAIAQISKTQIKTELIAINDERLEASITCSRIIIALFSRMINPEQLSIINSLNSVISKEQTLYLLFTRQFSYTELDTYFWTKPFFLFFDNDPENNLTRFYNEDSGGNESRLYWSKILDFTFELNQVLKGKNNKQKIIYLAETNPDQYEYRDAIKSELTQRGFSVTPLHLLIGTLAEKSEQVEQYLNSAVMSIHLIGNYAGRIITGSDSSMIDLQCQMAAKRLHDNENNVETFYRLISIQQGVKLTDERQRRLVNSLLHEEKNPFSDIIQAPVEEVKSFIRQKLQQLNNKNTPIFEGLSESVYIICEPDKFNDIGSIAEILKKNGFSVLTIDYTNLNNNILSKHYDFLNIASSVLICDFDSPKHWISSKVKDIMKAPGNGRTKPFLAKAILSKKPSEISLPIGFNDSIIIDASSINEQILKPFLNKINPQ